MPSLFAASMTVLPCGTCTARPSTSMFSNAAGALIRCAAPKPAPSRSRSQVLRHEAFLVLDVVRELAAEMLDEALHGHRGRIAERADRAAHDVVGDVRQHVEVLGSPGALLDPVHHPPQPAGALAARRA